MIFVSAIRKLRSSQRQQTNRFDKITKGVIQGVKRYYLRTSSGILYRPPYPQGCSFQHGVMETAISIGRPGFKYQILSPADRWYFRLFHPHRSHLLLIPSNTLFLKNFQIRKKKKEICIQNGNTFSK